MEKYKRVTKVTLLVLGLMIMASIVFSSCNYKKRESIRVAERTYNVTKIVKAKLSLIERRDTTLGLKYSDNTLEVIGKQEYAVFNVGDTLIRNNKNIFTP